METVGTDAELEPDALEPELLELDGAAEMVKLEEPTPPAPALELTTDVALLEGGGTLVVTAVTVVAPPEGELDTV